MRYSLRAPDGTVLDEGEGRATVTDGTLVVSPLVGQPLRIRPSEVTAFGEPEPFMVRLDLREGPHLILTQVGPMRTQLLAQFGQARAAALTDDLLLAGLGTPLTFPGTANGSEAEIRLYDDVLVVLPTAGEPIQVPYAFVEDVTTDGGGYQILVDSGEPEPLVLARMARRTTEILETLRERVTDARGRTSAFLAALLPGLGSMGLRSAAGLLRDGLAAPKSALDAVDPGIWPALLDSVTLPDRRAARDRLCAMGTVWLGFRQLVSVEQAAEGVEEWSDSTADTAREHDSGDHGLGTGMGGMMRASMLSGGPMQRLQRGGGFGGPDGGMGALGTVMAMNMLGLTPGERDDAEHAERADTERSSLVAAGTDLDALTASGEEPTVLAFLFVEAGGRVAYEVLNAPDHATYVYTTPDVRPLNRALALLGFRVEAIYAADGIASTYRQAIERLPSLRLLRENLAGRAIHGQAWETQLQRLLTAN